MKVKVVGTGSIFNEYNSACYLIDNNIMIDMPNGLVKNLYKQKVKPYEIEHVLLTHFHADHYFDIPFYILNRSKNKKEKTYIYCSNDGEKKIKKLGILAFPNSFKKMYKSLPVVYNFSSKFNIGKYIVSKFLVEHGNMKPAYGYVFKDNNKKIGFTGDTSLCESVETITSQVNYLFCDCTLIIGTESHMGIDNLKYLSNKYSNCKFIANHLGNKTRKELKKLKLKNVIILNDGDEIVI